MSNHKMLRIDNRFKRFVKSKAVNQILCGLLAFFVTAIGAWRFKSHPADRWLPMPLIGLAFLVLLFQILRAVIEFDEEARASSAEPLMIILETLSAMLGNGEPLDHGLRLCVFIRDNDEFVQLTDYVGDAPGKKHRRFSIKSGIVGNVFRCQTPKTAVSNLPKNRELQEFLISDFGYTPAEAAACRQDRRAWAVAPIGVKGQIVAAIYCDSRVFGFFGKSGTFRRKVLDSAILGIAKYLDGR